MKTYSTPREQGHKAAKNGKSYGDNPYMGIDPNYTEWMTGFITFKGSIPRHL